MAPLSSISIRWSRVYSTTVKMQYGTVLLVAVCLFGCAFAEEKVVEESEAQERLILLRSTFTSIRVSSTTTTVPYSCNTTPTTPAACRRRRRRRSPAKANVAPLTTPEESVPQLTASQDAQKGAVASDAEGRLFFTVWTTSFSTFTTTSSATNFLTTVSYSMVCTAPGMTLLPQC